MIKTMTSINSCYQCEYGELGNTANICKECTDDKQNFVNVKPDAKNNAIWNKRLHRYCVNCGNLIMPGVHKQPTWEHANSFVKCKNPEPPKYN